MDSISRNKLKEFFRTSRGAKLTAIAATLVVIIAGYLMVRTFASGFFSATEAEQAAVSGNAQVVSDSGASGGQAIEFKEPVTPPPPTTVSGYPAGHNTGYPHGMPGDTRTPVTLRTWGGPCGDITSSTSNDMIDGIQDGKIVISGFDIPCQLNIRTTGVTIKNSRFRVANTGALNINDYYHVTIMDTEFDGQRKDNSAGGISLIGDGSYTCVRCDIHSSGDLVRANWGGVAIVDSWLHDNYCLQGSCHNDAIQSTGETCGDAASNMGPIPGTSDGSNSTSIATYCLRIIHNRIENPNNQTSNILLKADLGDIHSVLVENNLFNGGGYTFYWYDSGHKIYDGVVRNNRFRRIPGGPSGACSGGVSPYRGTSTDIATSGYWPNGGCYGAVASNVGDSSRYPTWVNNVWDDNGAQINF